MFLLACVPTVCVGVVRVHQLTSTAIDPHNPHPLPQILTFVDAQLFNQLLLQPELCSAANAKRALRGLKQVGLQRVSCCACCARCELRGWAQRRAASELAAACETLTCNLMPARLFEFTGGWPAA